MNLSMIWLLLFSLGFFGVIRLTEFLYKQYHFPAELTRKLAHFLSAMSSILFMVLFDDYRYVLFMGIFFFLVLYVGRRKNKFRSIDAIGRKSAGSYLLPVSISILFVGSSISGNSLHYILPLLILGIADPIAGLAGTYMSFFRKEIRFLGVKTGKTFVGSFFFFFTTLLLTFILLKFWGYSGNELVILLLTLTFFATIIELISSKGIDNLSVPLAVLFILYNQEYIYSIFLS